MVQMKVGSKVGSVAATSPKAGLKGGAKQNGANVAFKNKKAPARKTISVTHGKSGLPSGVTAKGANPFKVTKQPVAFSNEGARFTKFVH